MDERERERKKRGRKEKRKKKDEGGEKKGRKPGSRFVEINSRSVPGSFQPGWEGVAGVEAETIRGDRMAGRFLFSF